MEEVVQANCPECNRTICLACSDEVSTNASKKKSNPTDTPDVLLHCPDLQAVILGVGLSLVEKLYYSDLQTPSGSSPNLRPAKKTKLETPNVNDQLSIELDPDEIMISRHHRGRNPGPKGVGYGGVASGRDDVRPFVFRGWFSSFSNAY